MYLFVARLCIGVDESTLPRSSVSIGFAESYSDLVMICRLSELGPFCPESLLHGFAYRLHSCCLLRICGEEGKKSVRRNDRIPSSVLPNC